MPKACEESSTPLRGAGSVLVSIFQGYAKNAYPWLIYLHASGVRTRVKARFKLGHHPALTVLDIGPHLFVNTLQIFRTVVDEPGLNRQWEGLCGGPRYVRFCFPLCPFSVR